MTAFLVVVGAPSCAAARASGHSGNGDERHALELVGLTEHTLHGKRFPGAAEVLANGGARVVHHFSRHLLPPG